MMLRNLYKITYCSVLRINNVIYQKFLIFKAFRRTGDRHEQPKHDFSNVKKERIFAEAEKEEKLTEEMFRLKETKPRMRKRSSCLESMKMTRQDCGGVVVETMMMVNEGQVVETL
ncbi:unnamed protein product [Cochlearia groenlandica]